MYQPESIAEYLSPAPRPSLTIQVVKMDNGYVTTLNEVPKRKPRKIRTIPNPFVGKTPDEMIDQMIDGVGAILRTFRQAEAEEEWKGGEDREKVRMAFKAMFPTLAQQAVDMTQEPDPEEEMPREPRHEQTVFETKDALVEYLTKNL